MCLKGTTTSFTVITKDDGNYEGVKNAVAEKGSKFVAYNIQYMLNGAASSPTGEYTLLLPNADGISEENILVLYIAGDGTVSEKEFVIDSDKIAVKTTESGTYVVVDKSATDDNKDEANDKTDGTVKEKTPNQSIIWIGVVVAVLLVAGLVVAVLIIKKKKNK